MTQQKEEPKESSGLGSVIASLVTLLLLIVALFVATLIGAAGVALVGRVLNLIFGLSLFEGALIALVTALSIGYFLFQALRPQYPFSPRPSNWDDEDFEDEEEDWEENEEEDEEDWENTKDVIIPPTSRNAPCPCGSGKKYKHCHGR